MGFSALGLLISTKLPLERQMLLAKTSPKVAHQQKTRGMAGGHSCGRTEGCWGGRSQGAQLYVTPHPNQSPWKENQFLLRHLNSTASI